MIAKPNTPAAAGNTNALSKFAIRSAPSRDRSTPSDEAPTRLNVEGSSRRYFEGDLSLVRPLPPERLAGRCGSGSPLRRIAGCLRRGPATRSRQIAETSSERADGVGSVAVGGAAGFLPFPGIQFCNPSRLT